MAGIFSALELKPDGDVSLARVKHAAAKPTLKDIQVFLKKKVVPTVLVSYPYGPKRITMFGYITGKESELSQHQLPPPCEVSEIYGSILLISHSSKNKWDTSVAFIDPFLPADYEVFYEKACSGELEEEDDEDEEGEAAADEGGEDEEQHGGSAGAASPCSPGEEGERGKGGDVCARNSDEIVVGGRIVSVFKYVVYRRVGVAVNE